MTLRQILLSVGVMLAVSIIGAAVLVLYILSDDGASTLERLERSNPAWVGIGRYGAPVPPRSVRE